MGTVRVKKLYLTQFPSVKYHTITVWLHQQSLALIQDQLQFPPELTSESGCARPLPKYVIRHVISSNPRVSREP